MTDGTTPRRDPVPDMWLATTEDTRIILSTPSGVILNHDLPTLALLARFGSAAVNAPNEGEILRFTAMQGGHACGDLELCDQDPEPPTLHAYRILIQESSDAGVTWG